MQFLNSLKGSIAESLIYSLLREAGYPVVYTSVETLLPALSLLDWASMEKLDLGSELRLLPDLLVLPREGSATFLEVKYRSRLDRDAIRQLAGKLRQQHASYPNACTVLIRGTSPRGESARIDDMVRVLPSNALELLAAADIFYHAAGADTAEDEKLEPLWSSLRALTSVYPRLQEHRAALEKVPPVIRCLSQL